MRNGTAPPTGGVVYVVEDDRAVRESLELLLRLKGYLPRGFASGEEFLACSTLQRPACALLDVRLPGIDGLRLQRELRVRHPGLPTIVITAHGDVSTARTALREGAVDFLEKPIDEGDLLEAVSTALASDQRILQEARDREEIEARLQRLTAREREVFERITDGQHNREIAEEFGISPRTVEVHRARIMEKLRARRVADLFRLRFALERNQAGG
ncbi:MAG: response regulator [Burkholderiaceae bacterium]|nr:response regulator [Burkholderiaceae bacterium]MCX8005688.1 response regulator [Burkholderiaceae bacterium]